MEINFVVPAVPVAQPRAKASSFGGRVKMYTPTKMKQSDGSSKDHPITAFKATVRTKFAEVYTGVPFNGALRVDLVFIFPRTKNLIWKTRPMPRLHHAKKPDRDNCDKAVLDALKGLAWVDDAQICDGRIQKWTAAGDEQPHVQVRIQTLTLGDGE